MGFNNGKTLGIVEVFSVMKGLMVIVVVVVINKKRKSYYHHHYHSYLSSFSSSSSLRDAIIFAFTLSMIFKFSFR